MNIRNTEFKVLKILWKDGEMPASQLYRKLEEQEGWKKSTTYTVLDKCIEKGFIERVEPHFVCRPLVEKNEIQDAKILDLIGTFFNNSKQDFIRAFLKDDGLTTEEIKEMKELIKKLK